jgi:hypothetical protein
MAKLRFKKGKVKKTAAVLSSSFGVFYDSEYSNDFPAGNYYLHAHKTMPFYVDFKPKYSIEVVEYFINNGFEVVWSFDRVTVNSEMLPTILVFEKNKTVITVRYKSDNKKTENSLVFRFKTLLDEENEDFSQDYVIMSGMYSDDEEVETIVKDIEKYVKTDKSKSKISLLMSTRGGMETIEQDVKDVDIDIPSHYGEGFVQVHEKIVEKLNEDKGKGLVLLHGVPGTGKTNYIRYLCGKLEKEVIFLPPFMAESIAGPDFITFLIEHTNSVLVIEDAEKVVLDREGDGSSRQSVANLLNLTDGILSDCLSIQIIATFNTSRDRIDKALLRKGRLIAEWKFDALGVEESNNLLASLGKDTRTTKPMTLSEIYNLDEKEFVVQQERNQIGFGR